MVLHESGSSRVSSMRWITESSFGWVTPRRERLHALTFLSRPIR